MRHLQTAPPLPPEMLSLACSVPRGRASSSNVIVSVEVPSATRRVREPTSESVQRIRAELIKGEGWRAAGVRVRCGAAAGEMAPVRAWAPLCGLLGSKGRKGGRGHERGGLGLGTEVETRREVPQCLPSRWLHVDCLRFPLGSVHSIHGEPSFLPMASR